MNDMIQGLVHASDETFYRTLGGITAAQRSADFVRDVCCAFRESALPDLRQAERLTAVLQKIRLEPDELRNLASAPPELTPALRNTLASFIPPHQRRRFASAGRAAAPVVFQTSAPPPGVEQKPGVSVVEEATDETSEPPPYSRVALLSATGQQDANRKLLSSNSFVPSVYDTLERFASDLAENFDICGCVIDRTFLQPLSEEEQRNLFSLIAGYSTFIVVRVDEGGLKLTPDAVQEILRTVRLHNRPVAARELSLQESGTLRHAELANFSRAAKVLRSFQSAAFIPGELREDQRRLLIAAAYEHANELRLRGEIRVEALETRFLRGGFSESQVALVRVNSESRAVVAKIGDKPAIKAELERFRTYIQAVDDQLKPFACFHGNCGAILFAFLDDDGDDSRPARMLDERLQTFWFEELSRADVAVAFANLCRGLGHAASALARLNRLRPTQGVMLPLGNPDVVTPYLERLEADGVDLGLPSIAVDARRRAAEKFITLTTAAVCHGDVHLRNILIRGDRSAHLIDFAGSGPGHPAVDLARLEVALFTEFFRPLRSEDDYVRMQRRMSIDLATFEELRAEFELERGPVINKLCVHGCVTARDKAMAIVGEHGGKPIDYLAAKCLVAWQTLLMHGRQAVLTRSIIRAVSEAFTAPASQASTQVD